MVDIGQEIRQEMDRQERGVTWLAKKAGIRRATIYDILRKKSIDTAVLVRISVALKKDFFEMLSEEVREKEETEEQSAIE